MHHSTDRAEWRVILENHDILDRLAEVEPGWATTPEVQFCVAPGDPRERARARRVLVALAKLDAIDTIDARHQGEPMAVYLVDPERIRKLLDEIEAGR